MSERTKKEQVPLGTGARRRSRSFLLRVWQEPREAEAEGSELRGYVRDLQTGDEHYVAAPGSLAELLERFVAEAERSDEEAAAEAPPQSESA